MSDLDESALTDGEGDVQSDEQFAESAAGRAGGDDEAEASYDDDEHAGELSPERGAGGDGAGFSDDDGYDGGVGGDNESRFDGGASYDGHADEFDEHGDDDGGDPSSIHAPTGASAATSDAAARLARLLAADQGDDGVSGGEGDDDELEQRMARKREIAALEAQLQRTSTSSSSSKRASAMREEKEPSASQRSQHASYRSGAQHADDMLDEDLDNMDDEFDDDDEYNGHSDGESEYGHGGHGHGGGGGGGDIDSDDEIRTAEDVARAKEEREHLIEVNKIRQKQIALILEREKQSHGGKSGTSGGSRGGGPGGAGAASMDDKHGLGLDGSGLHPEQIRVEYLKNLENLNLLWDELESKREEAEERIDRLTTKLDAADERASELSDSFKSFKREISKEARFSRTGKPIKLKRILAFEAAEEAAEREVARVRLRHINLLNELRTLEDAVRTKEKLAEGLHLIDFEQLKIENQTLNEKIEERNDELHKLKKKTTTTVQVLTHIKEKLQCVREENAISAAEVAKLNEAVSQLRDALTRAKQGRDQSRLENQLLKQKQGFIGSDLLVSDFENRKGDIEGLRAEVEALKARWRALNNLSVKAANIERSHARTDSEQAMQRQTHYATVKFGGAQGAAAAAAAAAAMGTAHSRR